MLESWTDFYAAVAGASSAMAGLVFVALSINLTRIVSGPGLPARAAETIIVLLAALIAALAGLIPGQSAQTFGLELAAVGLTAWGVPLCFQIAAARAKRYSTRKLFLLRMALHQVATLPILIASALMLNARPDGPYWLAAGIILTLVFGLQNAWVLLVEIER